MLHDGRQVSLLQLDDLLRLVDVEEVAPLQVSRVLVALGWDGLLSVLVELPVDADGGVVCEDVQVLSQLLEEVGVLARLVLLQDRLLRRREVTHLLLLLDVGLDAGRPVRRLVLRDDVDELVHLLPQAQHRQVAHPVEEVKVERPPLVDLDLLLGSV